MEQYSVKGTCNSKEWNSIVWREHVTLKNGTVYGVKGKCDSKGWNRYSVKGTCNSKE